MTYVALLYSPSLDQFETDCYSLVWDSEHMADWVGDLPKYYNEYNNVKDFYIVSITKIGE